MTPDELAKRIDQTLLKPDVTEKEISRFLDEAKPYPFASACIPPCYVPLAVSKLKESPLKVCTVTGFPLGYQATAAKVKEAETAILNGADEIDMVMNISAFRSGNHDAVKAEIQAVKHVLEDRTLKVIIETCYLTDDEKRLACSLVVAGGGDYVKTSTGFGPAGATVEDVKLLAGQSAEWIKVKASGGIKTLGQALAILEAGAGRIGTSSGVAIIEEAMRKENG